MLEANEETLENWWFKHYAKGVDSDLGTYLCVTRMKGKAAVFRHWNRIFLFFIISRLSITAECLAL